MNKIKSIISCLVVCVLIVLLCSCGKENKSDYYSEIYGEAIAGLEDDELFAIVEINAASPVLLVTSETYDDGNGNQAAIWCNVYYAPDGEVKNIGTIESMGTAYPVSYDKEGIYTASGHAVQRFGIDDKTGTIILEEGICEQFDESGNAAYYTIEEGDKTETATEEAYYKMFEKYSEADVVNFNYGASGAN